MGTRRSFPGGKAAGSWSWPLTSISAKVKNAWSYTSPPQYVFMAWCFFKHKDKFISALIVILLVEIFPASYGSRKFITVFIRACHWSLSWARWIQSTSSQPIFMRWSLSSCHLHLEEDVAGGWRRHQIGELHNLHTSWIVMRVIKSRRMRWEARR
jgi:hypothetical protein